MIFALLACDRAVQGEVRSPDGQPVVGASVVSPECEAVSAVDGRWRTRCPREPVTFTVRRPGFEPGVAHEGGTTTLVPFPTEPGPYRREAPGWLALPLVPLLRKEGAGRIAWCLDAVSLPELATPVDLVDVHAADWRAFRLDPEGCAWQLVQGTGTFWGSEGEQVETPLRTAVSAGTDRLTWSLGGGRYVIVEWLDGAPSPSPEGGARAWGFEVP